MKKIVIYEIIIPYLNGDLRQLVTMTHDVEDYIIVWKDERKDGDSWKERTFLRGEDCLRIPVEEMDKFIAFLVQSQGI